MPSPAPSGGPPSDASWGRSFGRPLPRSFYARPTRRVARDLLGCFLVRRVRRGRGPPGWRVGRVVETEAYVGGDLANHAARGETARNRSMFLGPGHLYVYRIHQVHCANLTTRPGQAVLLRAVEPLRSLPGSTRGPGLLCRAYGLSRAQDGEDLITGELRVVAPAAPRSERVVTTPRIGISRSVELPLRFLLNGSPWVSGPRRRREGGA